VKNIILVGVGIFGLFIVMGTDFKKSKNKLTARQRAHKRGWKIYGYLKN